VTSVGRAEPVCTVRRSAHGFARCARCGLQARCRSRAEPPICTVPGSRSGAVLRAGCPLVALHGARKRARGCEVRTGLRTGGSVPVVRRASRAHGAGFAVRCGVACWAPTCGAARCAEARTGLRSAHGARKCARGCEVRTVRPGGVVRFVPSRARGAAFAIRCGVACWVPACGAARCAEARTGLRGAHGVAKCARCGREARCGPCVVPPVRTVPRSPSGAALRARCPLVALHGARKRARGCEVRTVR
jgi:hypothetical protein